MPKPLWIKTFGPTAAPGVALAQPGQINSDLQKSCQAKNFAESKIFLFYRTTTHRYITPIPSRPEGRIMIAAIVGRVAVDAGSADKRTA